MDRTTKTQVRTYTVKKVNDFPVPWPGIIKLFPARESLVSEMKIPAGDGKMANLFYSVSSKTDSGKQYDNPI
jgi:hypothetical protein